MTVTLPSGTTRIADLRDGLTVTLIEHGVPGTVPGIGALVLHGGAGPRSVAGLAAALGQDGYSYVAVPTHPGFDGTPRPASIDSVADLATAYLDLLDDLDLHDVTVFGSSIGGWIAAEMALRDNHARISALVLLASTGIAPEPPLRIADPAELGPVRTGELAYYRADLRPDPAALSEEQRAVLAANQRTQAILAPGSYDPKLRDRLHRVAIPVLVLAGEQDGIVPLEYEHALAAAFPLATLRHVPEAAHFPHIEQPELVLAAVADFIEKRIEL
jgi:pimeloyl-ACP methyl ester carboxylesterase